MWNNPTFQAALTAAEEQMQLEREEEKRQLVQKKKEEKRREKEVRIVSTLMGVLYPSEMLLNIKVCICVCAEGRGKTEADQKATGAPEASQTTLQ